jgi:hypothetical protein
VITKTIVPIASNVRRYSVNLLTLSALLTAFVFAPALFGDPGYGLREQTARRECWGPQAGLTCNSFWEVVGLSEYYDTLGGSVYQDNPPEAVNSS